jgi:hypothetical protein
MKASTRINLLHQRLQAIAARPDEPVDRLLRELQSCLTTEAQNLLDNYGAGAGSVRPIHWLTTTPPEEIPVSDYAVDEFRRSLANWRPTANPHEALAQVTNAVTGLVVYQTGWSAQVEDQPLEALFDEQSGEVVIEDLSGCYRLNGEICLNPGPLRPATKSELLARGLYTYHSAARLT